MSKKAGSTKAPSGGSDGGETRARARRRTVVTAGRGNGHGPSQEKRRPRPAGNAGRPLRGPIRRGPVKVLRTRTARETGLPVSVIDNRDASFEAGAEHGWATVCEEHSTYALHSTRRLAESHAAKPTGWCKKCRAMNETPDQRAGGVAPASPALVEGLLGRIRTLRRSAGVALARLGLVVDAPLARLRRDQRSVGLTLALVGILLVAALLRYWQLSRVGFRGDEAVYAGQAALLSGGEGYHGQLVLVSRGNSNFLLFQELVSLIYRVVGVSDLPARLLAATCSTLTVLVTYFIGARLYRPRAGLVAAAFVAVSGYSVTLGRLALLDSLLALLVALSMFCLVMLEQTGRGRWLFRFAVCAALATQAKVAGALVLVIFVLYLLATPSLRRIGLRRLVLAGAVFMIGFLPAIAQLFGDGSTWAGLLANSAQRSSDVPWDYYPRVLLHHDGAALVGLWAIGLLVALRRRSRADALPLLWVLVIGAFYQAYPLKGFNYLLPIVPALALLAAHAVSDLDGLVSSLARRRRTLRPLVTRSAAAVVGIAALGSAQALATVVRDDSFGGLREAAGWLRENAPPDAGVMTISHGSAQYVFLYYADQPAYPFGRFNLPTVVPGRRLIRPSLPAPGQKTPRDWVVKWPRRLIKHGSVSFLVYYTGPLDDPPEESEIVGTSTQRMFRRLIDRYGGKLVHTVYRDHEGRVWIYRLTKNVPKPTVRPSVDDHVVTARASGFARGAPVRAYYHDRLVTRGTANAEGRVALRFPLPAATRPRYLLVLTDNSGNSVSGHILTPEVTARIRGGRLIVHGARFAARSVVRVTYHRLALGLARSDGRGKLALSLPTPRATAPRWQLVATDADGNHARVRLPVPRRRAR